MVCRAGGVPRPTITWVKALAGNNEKIVGVGEQFTIANTSGSDDGKYTCRAKNELGSDSREVTLHVQSTSEVVSQVFVSVKFSRFSNTRVKNKNRHLVLNGHIVFKVALPWTVKNKHGSPV